MKILTFISAIAALLLSCTPEPEVDVRNDVPLSAPELLSDGNNVCWEAVEGVASYQLLIDETIVNLACDCLSYNVGAQGYGSHEVKIKVIGRSGF